MVLEYDSNTNFAALAPILEEYADWFARIALCIAYHEEEISNDIVAPSSFQNWMDNGDLVSSISESVTKIYKDMIQAGAGILEKLNNQTKPTHKEFVEFKNLYSSFLSHIRRLEKDSAMEGSGFDKETGLRNPKLIEADLNKEVERLARGGNPFSIVAARIDHFAGQKNQSKALSVAVSNIKECMRPFDDAYYMGNGHFILALKHADIFGAEVAINRLQQYLREDEEITPKITMSYSMVEPVDGDDIPILLKSIRQDLDDHLNDHDAVLKFKEVSPLERFMSGAES